MLGQGPVLPVILMPTAIPGPGIGIAACSGRTDMEMGAGERRLGTLGRGGGGDHDQIKPPFLLQASCKLA